MEANKNLMDLCFELTDKYEQYFKHKLQDNFINDKDIDAIINNFDFRKEIIFSLNKEYKKGKNIHDFCKKNGISSRIPSMINFHKSLYSHQEEAIKSILNDTCTVISTGTGSGKTESFLIPILDYCIKNPSKGIKAILIYPMNALAGDQMRRIADSVEGTDISFGIFTGSTPSRENSKNPINTLSPNQIMYREDIIEKQPDILITNYVMIDWILTDLKKRKMIVESKNSLKYIVLDEIHTYRGNKGTHIKLLLQRLKAFLREDIVQIGCSATLSRSKEGKKQEGYLGGIEIDEYIKKMFTIKQYRYIEPNYDRILAYNRPLYDNEYNELENNDITKELKNYLSEESRTLTEILQMLHSKSINISTNEFREFLKRIVKMNNKYKSYPILDFRVHIFLLEISNTLKRCINCGRYHSSSSNTCNACGQPVFSVYRYDYTKCIGRINDNRLCSELIPSYDESMASFYVLIDNKKLGLENRDLEGDKLSFKSHYQIIEDSIKLEYEKEGQLQLYYMKDVKNYKDYIINLGESHKKEFIYNLFKESLLNIKDSDKKILAFIDNRESAGRYSAVINDEFLSDFFMHCIKLINNGQKDLNINDIYEETINELNNLYSMGYDMELQKTLLEEFYVWFIRSISIPEDSVLEETPKLRLQVSEEIFNECENEFLDILLKEKILDRNILREKGKYIRFYCGYSKYKRGVIIRSLSKDNAEKYDYISFTSSSQKYRYFNEKYPGKIENIVTSLKSKGILIEEKIDRKDSIYFLNPAMVGFDIDSSDYGNFNDIISQELLFAGAHSSEVRIDIKRKNEKEFQNGNLNVLFSTPTLEMGIDIGKLNMVYMVGVPPMPSNYAQRSGRAGRQGNRFALLVTVCSENNNHDMYYFNNPKEMIEGLITPPSFDANNCKVIEKHINAHIIPNYYTEMSRNKSESILTNKLVNNCSKVFGNLESLDEYIKNSKELCVFIKEQRLFQQKLYELGIYPDYGFRRDEVKAVDIKYKKALKKNKEVDEKDYILSFRDPEQAYKVFIPEKSMFLGEDYYKFTSEGDFSLVELEENDFFREYKSVYCDDNIQNISKNKSLIAYDTIIKIMSTKNNIHNELNENEILTVYLEKELPIYFINRGKNAKNGIQKFYDSNGYFNIGYKIARDALLLEFSSDVVSKEYCVSLCAALDRTIKDVLGLDESELGWLIDEKLDVNLHTKGKHYVVMYDKLGCGNLDVNRIYINLKDLIKKTYTKLTQCSCGASGGCYLCMKGYNAQRYSPLMNKNHAIIFTGYLLKTNKFKPEIIMEYEINYYDLELILKLDTSQKIIQVIEDDKVIYKDNYTETNKAVFSAFAKVLKDSLGNEEIESIEIKSKQDYIVNAINETGNLDSGLNELRLFKFYTLGFKKVKGVKI